MADNAMELSATLETRELYASLSDAAAKVGAFAEASIKEFKRIDGAVEKSAKIVQSASESAIEAHNRERAALSARIAGNEALAKSLENTYRLQDETRGLERRGVVDAADMVKETQGMRDELTRVNAVKEAEDNAHAFRIQALAKLEAFKAEAAAKEIQLQATVDAAHDKSHAQERAHDEETMRMIQAQYMARFNAKQALIAADNQMLAKQPRLSYGEEALSKAELARLRESRSMGGVHHAGLQGGASGNAGWKIGQASMQFQDIAVQMQMGTRTSVILAQQGSQLASIFGTTSGKGPLLGAAIAIGGAFVAMGQQAEDAFGKIIAGANDASREMTTARLDGIDAISKSLEKLSQTEDALLDKGNGGLFGFAAVAALKASDLLADPTNYDYDTDAEGRRFREQTAALTELNRLNKEANASAMEDDARVTELAMARANGDAEKVRMLEEELRLRKELHGIATGGYNNLNKQRLQERAIERSNDVTAALASREAKRKANEDAARMDRAQSKSGEIGYEIATDEQKKEILEGQIAAEKKLRDQSKGVESTEHSNAMLAKQLQLDALVAKMNAKILSEQEKITAEHEKQAKLKAGAAQEEESTRQKLIRLVGEQKQGQIDAQWLNGLDREKAITAQSERLLEIQKTKVKLGEELADQSKDRMDGEKKTTDELDKQKAKLSQMVNTDIWKGVEDRMNPQAAKDAKKKDKEEQRALRAEIDEKIREENEQRRKSGRRRLTPDEERDIRKNDMNIANAGRKEGNIARVAKEDITTLAVAIAAENAKLLFK